MRTRKDIAKAPEVIVRRFLRCAQCALWRQTLEDSLAADYGLCPRRRHPHNRTCFNDGCVFGVRPVEK